MKPTTLIAMARRLIALALMLAIPFAQAAETITFFHNDVSGTPMLATDAGGNVIWKERYRPYGERTVKSPASANNKIAFAGRPFDPYTGLSYHGARYYDPQLGRFLGVDPVEVVPTNPHSFNRYAYANNNPYRFVDPDGRYADLAVEAASITIGVKSFADNWHAGNFGAATVDGLGIFGDAVLAVVPGVPGAIGLGIKASREGAEIVGKVGAKEASAASKVFSKEKQALVDMAKADKKTGMTSEDMQAYKELNRQLPDPFPTNKVRGPEAHSSGAPSSQAPHGHVGPVDHIPIRDPQP